ncbi:MAG: TIGR03960 family B12-binding radical SAM protein [Deltaproteobacteria bacterium]|nr:TIGR03960 family B12-binding radical SAM protein [Deltaproteobacteria bacterium]
MSILTKSWFSSIRRPSRYIGGEINVVKKDLSRIDVSVALLFPDVYEVGMSHLGLKILYHLLNDKRWLAAERAFSPWIDLETEMRERGIPLTTLESNRPLSAFDLVGFSLQHELCYTNILTMLALSGIPFFSQDRSDVFPLIVAGGPACFNPEPVADFFDLMIIGDGEAALLDICREIRRAKKEKRAQKADVLSRLRHISGVYIPSLFHVRHDSDGRIEQIDPERSDYAIVHRAIVPDIDLYPYPERQVVPFTELVHDRLSVEVSRGCTRGCRFCQAGMIYRPVRERSLESVMNQAEGALNRTGYDEVSLLSLSAGDYSAISPLLQQMMDRHATDHIGVSLPSLRVDTLNHAVIEEIRRVRKTGFTLAPEAGNDRLRRVINKGFTEEQILETARIVYDAGWRVIKLYFMIGLPFEEDRDLLDIVRLVKRISGISGKRGRKPNVNVSISTFVPKAHTPFMWCRQIPLMESRRRMDLIRDGLKRTRVKIKWNQPELSWLEGIFARGIESSVKPSQSPGSVGRGSIHGGNAFG